jgi:plasmid stability protein
MDRTTIILGADLLWQVRRKASAEGKTLTAVIREILTAYFEKQREPRTFTFTASGRSGKGNLSQDVEKILRQRARRQRK